MTIATCQSAMQEEKLRKGPWVEEEDERLATFVKLLGERKWDSIARESGLKRSGKSCRMRWLNYLRPNVKRGHISAEEDQIIIQLQKQWGNKWSKIARKLPGRTDNEIKNHWRTYLRKKVQAQEEGEYHCKLKNVKQDCIYQSCDVSVQECDTGSHKPALGNKGSSDPSLELYDLSSLVYPSSPYEIRLFDWMSELSDDQTELKIHCDCSNRGSCSCYLTWKYEDSGSSIFNSLGSLWDMN